jgi:hypothetical protein
MQRCLLNVELMRDAIVVRSESPKKTTLQNTLLDRSDRKVASSSDCRSDFGLMLDNIA